LRGEAGEQRVETSSFVNAAGPEVKSVGRLLGLDVPVFWEKHLKVAFLDSLVALPRHAPLLIWTDPQRLAWTEDERRFLVEAAETRWLLDEFPPGVHTRPEGGAGSQTVLGLWAYHAGPVEPVFPLEVDELYPEVVLRGLSAMVPALAGYFERLPRPVVDGGYYTKTRENRLLSGPLAVPGAYVIGALSGYGLMAACAAGELLALHLTGGPLPSYAADFSPARYADPGYLERLSAWQSAGQL
jgi:glycine/D-amino acid oxidase-like deaminating enzyme